MRILLGSQNPRITILPRVRQPDWALEAKRAAAIFGACNRIEFHLETPDGRGNPVVEERPHGPNHKTQGRK